MVTALYRRYRPDSFQTMIGQSHVTEPLMAALRSGKVGHAYLFSGPRGCGKTTSARILARCLNCAEGPTDSPCGKCESCVELGQGGAGSVDVVEIDAASHGSVDDARDLRDRAVFMPVRDRYKIFIIDEAHMVTPNGFNALLKIVEEPPAHLKFIFATTEPEKVLGTIRSRTQHYPFRLVAPGPLIDYTEKLLQAENMRVEDGVLQLVTRAGGGSVRDTLSVLDQLISGADGVVSLEMASALLGYTSSEMIDAVVQAIADGDSASVFQAVDKVLQTGQDARRFTDDLLQRLRDLIVISATNVDGATVIFRGTAQDQLTRMFAQQQLFERGALSAIADVVSKALDEMRGASSPRMQLELMLARVMVKREIARANDVHVDDSAHRVSQTSTVPIPVQPTQQASPAQLAQPTTQVNTQEETIDPVSVLRNARAIINNEPQTNSAATRSALQAQMDKIATSPPSQEFLKEDKPQMPAIPEPEQSASEMQQASTEELADTPDSNDIAQIWDEILQDIAADNQRVFQAIVPAVPVRLEGDKLFVGFVSQAELNDFKQHGAAPLREAIEGAIGVTVKYHPTQVTQQQRDAQIAKYSGRTGGAAPKQQTADGGADAEEPHREPLTGQTHDIAPMLARVQAISEMALAEESKETVETESVLASVPDESEPEQNPDPEPAESSAPQIVRSGDAVIRQVLGGKFVREEKINQNTESATEQIKNQLLEESLIEIV